MTASEDILDGNIEHSHYLERYKASVVRKILTILNRSDKDLSERLLKIELAGKDIANPAVAKRLTVLLDEVNAKITELTSFMYDETKTELYDFSEYEADFQHKLMTGALDGAGVAVSLNSPSVSQLRAIVDARPFQGKLLKEWYDTLSDDLQVRIRDTVRTGLIEGKTTAEIVRAVRGSKTLNYEDGLLRITRTHADAIVRTAIAHTANYASEGLYAANENIVKGVRWLATLDSRTTAICASRDGKVYPVKSGPRPPAHMRCRSTTIPYLGDEPDGFRASANGPVPAKLNYDGWLRTQTPALQVEILGKAKAELFRAGMKIDKFVDTSGKEYTLSQLRKIDQKRFDKTFGPIDEASNAQAKEFREYLGEATYPKLKTSFDKAVKGSGQSLNGLTEEEGVALHAYTHGDKYFDRLNHAFRFGDAEEIARVAPMARMLDSALNKLPKYEGFVQRVTDLPDNVWVEMRKSKVYFDRAFMSASVKDVTSDFQGAYEFTILSKTGRKIQGFSDFPEETEVLFPRERKFDIIRISNNTDTDRIVVEMVERDD